MTTNERLNRDRYAYLHMNSSLAMDQTGDSTQSQDAHHRGHGHSHDRGKPANTINPFQYVLFCHLFSL